MVKVTQNHGWEVPEHGNDNYPEVLDSLVEQIDRSVVIKGALAARPAAGIRGRWYLATDQEEPLLSYDDGEAWSDIATEIDLPDNVLLVDENQVISGEWQFRRTIDADITGSAAFAEEADFATESGNAERLAGTPGTEFQRRTTQQTITGEREFEETVYFHEGLNIENGILQLPVYEGADPSDDMIEEPCIWFRADHQPS